ncbi:MAG: dockerin type I repeat-containing protein [Phycisphaeraceae bacterium]|nr:dockerin type I repeat-containing protein [Phycisphaeraceae bacterium]
MRLLATGIVAALTAMSGAEASTTIITQWNFNGPSNTEVPGGPLSPLPSTGAGSAQLVGDAVAQFATGASNNGSSDPAGGPPPPNYGWNISGFPIFLTEGSGLNGVQFNVSTVGFEDISLSFDTRHSNSVSAWVEVRYTLDGVNFTNAGLDNDGQFSANQGDWWFNNRVVDFSGIPGVNNNPNFGVRVVTIFSPVPFIDFNFNVWGPNEAFAASDPNSPYGTGGFGGGGTLRFDMVTISGKTPGPSCGAGDVNCDGLVNGADIAIVLGSWGPCVDCAADLNGDGVVNGADIAIVLGNWG